MVALNFVPSFLTAPSSFLICPCCRSTIHRVRSPLEKCLLRLGDVHEWKLRYVVPAEMVRLTIRPRILEGFHGDSLRVSVLPRGEAAS